MNIHIVVSVARQIEGEYVFVKTEKAFKTVEKATEYMNELKKQYTKDDKSIPMKLTTPHGDVVCYFELGIFEVILED